MTTGQCPRQAAVSALPTLCCVGMLGNWRTQGWGLLLQTLSFVGKPICPFRYRFSCESFSQGCKSSNCLFWGGGSNLDSAIDVEENAFVRPSSDRKGQKWIMFRDIHLIALMSQSCRYSSAFNHMFWLATVAPFSHSDDYWEIMTNTRFWKKKKKKHCWLFSCSGLDRGKKPHNLHLVNHGSGITDQVPEVQPLMSVGINKQKIKWTCVRPMYKYQYY